jgi:uncharacterized membrane protein
VKILLIIVISIVLAVGLVAAVGAFLPRGHIATRAATYRQAPAELYAVVRAFDQTPRWRTGLESVEMLPPENGRLVFREHGAHRAVAYRVVEDSPGKRLVIEIADRDLPYGGTWTFEFLPGEAGTTLRITENGEVKNVIFRFMARFFLGYTRTIETYLKDLAKKFAEPIRLDP